MTEHDKYIQDQNRQDELARIANDPANSINTAAPQGAKGDVAPNAATDPSDAATAHEAVARVLADAHEDSPDSETADPPATDSQPSTEAKPPVKPTNEKPEGDAEDEDDEEDTTPESPEAKAQREANEKAFNERFDKHPRWQEVQQKLRELEPLAENAKLDAKFCADYNIGPEQKAQAMQLLALANTNPKGCIEQLEKLVADMKLATGLTLPKDLAAEVEAATMSLERAKELAQARLQLEASKAQAQRQQQQQVQTYQQQVTQSLDTWGELQSRKDADFKPGTEKFDLTVKLLKLAVIDNPPKTIADHIALAEKAYADANKFFARATPTPRARRVLRGDMLTASDSPQTELPKEGETAAQFVARTVGKKHGLHLNGAAH